MSQAPTLTQTVEFHQLTIDQAQYVHGRFQSGDHYSYRYSIAADGRVLCRQFIPARPAHATV